MPRLLGCAGSIPACAGEPRRRGCRCVPGWVYPRVCGGTALKEATHEYERGLSPRVRGNLAGTPAGFVPAGSIPACAGEPGTVRLPDRWSAVYPRVCGGTVELPAMTDQPDGLSPRVRGNPVGNRAGDAVDGSIPACAGEPGTHPLHHLPIAVYPRVCGGTRRRVSLANTPGGLSPRVRGNPPTGISNTVIAGSIPACAGEPAVAGRAAVRNEVYPRVCGGTISGTSMDSVARGLSPRVRGNLPPAPYPVRKPGSIPACAGEPPATRRTAPLAGVYPRVCGGTNPRGAVSIALPGLSPRVRGNPHLVFCHSLE